MNPNQLPTVAEYGLRRAYAGRLGISQTQFVAMFGTQDNPKTRGEGAANLAAWCKQLPKGME